MSLTAARRLSHQSLLLPIASRRLSDQGSERHRDDLGATAFLLVDGDAATVGEFNPAGNILFAAGEGAGRMKSNDSLCQVARRDLSDQLGRDVVGGDEFDWREFLRQRSLRVEAEAALFILEDDRAISFGSEDLLEGADSVGLVSVGLDVHVRFLYRS